MEKLRIIFMGTPEFAVNSLDILIQNGYNIVGVITAVDKPAGRGKKLNESAIKKYAVENNLLLLQPLNLKDPDFQNLLKSLNADLQIVVAFRMLPESIWNMPKYGTFNLHASLLPQYRGAAPINWAIINGEKETGISTFFLDHKIDTGNIILQEKVAIEKNETAGSLHDKLQVLGSGLVLKTVDLITSDKYQTIQQNDAGSETLKDAPKLYKSDCRIDWTKPAKQVCNQIHGLSPYPAAFTELISPEGIRQQIKIFKVDFIPSNNTLKPGNIETDNKSFLKVNTLNGSISFLELQLAGKRRMKVEDFLKGFRIDNSWKLA